jgi:hypothetical protein
MKLRIKGNSIRIRLTQSDVRKLEEEGSVVEAVHFSASNSLMYEVRAMPNESILAEFEYGRICISIPHSEAERWIGSDRVGIEEIQLMHDEQSLRILIEKDFACLQDREGEDETDAFPNPLKVANC